MSNQIDREGIFRANIINYGVQNFDSGSVGIAVTADLTAMWMPPADGNEGYWDDWSSYGYQADGTIIVVKKDGTMHKPQVEALCRHAGWDGNLEAVALGTWEPKPVQVTIKREVYKKEGYDEQISFRINFINDYERSPGSKGNVDAAKASELQSRYGGSLRAIAATVAQNAIPPANGKPSAPPARKGPPPQGVPTNQAKAAREAAEASGEKIPF